MRKTRKIVTYNIDFIDSGANFYDAPGPVFFCFKPTSKTNWQTKGKWIKICAKYRNAKRISEKTGICLGGNYGIFAMPRYSVSTTISGNWKHSSLFSIALWREIEKHILYLAMTALKTLNKSGHLTISYGDLVPTITESQELHVQFNLGFQLHPRTNIDSHPCEAIVWDYASN